MTLSLNKIVFIVILICLLLLLGISGVYGGYYLVNGPAGLQQELLKKLPLTDSFFSGLIIYTGFGLLSLVGAVWILTRISFLAWHHQKGISRTITI